MKRTARVHWCTAVLPLKESSWVVIAPSQASVVPNISREITRESKTPVVVLAIMPSKYTDEIENSSYMLGGYFL